VAPLPEAQTSAAVSGSASAAPLAAAAATARNAAPERRRQRRNVTRLRKGGAVRECRGLRAALQVGKARRERAKRRRVSLRTRTHTKACARASKAARARTRGKRGEARRNGRCQSVAKEYARQPVISRPTHVVRQRVGEGVGIGQCALAGHEAAQCGADSQEQ
jgi:hypothetical protein